MQMPPEADRFLVDARDEDTFAQRVEELLSNRELAEEVGRLGRERIRERFLITRLVADELELLGSL